MNHPSILQAVGFIAGLAFVLTICACLICKGQPPTDGTESNCEDSDY